MAWVKREVPILVFAICSLLLMLAYFVPYEPIVKISGDIMQFGITITAFSLTLGGVNLLRIHGNQIIKRTPKEWYWSAYIIFMIALVSLVGVIWGPAHPAYSWINLNLNLPLGASMYSILGFYVASAAFRAFRARNVESALLLICAIFVMLKNAPIGETVWVGFKTIGAWITDYPQNMGWRIFWIGVGVGWIALYIRTLVGKETAPLGFGREE